MVNQIEENSNTNDLSHIRWENCVQILYKVKELSCNLNVNRIDMEPLQHVTFLRYGT
jgi:hypothetical protein